MDIVGSGKTDSCPSFTSQTKSTFVSQAATNLRLFRTLFPPSKKNDQVESPSVTNVPIIDEDFVGFDENDPIRLRLLNKLKVNKDFREKILNDNLEKTDSRLEFSEIKPFEMTDSTTLPMGVDASTNDSEGSTTKKLINKFLPKDKNEKNLIKGTRVKQINHPSEVMKISPTSNTKIEIEEETNTLTCRPEGVEHIGATEDSIFLSRQSNSQCGYIKAVVPLDLDDVAESGFPIIVQRPYFPPKPLCFLCGSAGEQLIYCSVCCEPYHSFCAGDDSLMAFERIAVKTDETLVKNKITEKTVENNVFLSPPLTPNSAYNDDPALRLKENFLTWKCGRCILCDTCGQNRRTSTGNSIKVKLEDNEFVKCLHCRKSHHINCLGKRYVDGLIGNELAEDNNQTGGDWVCENCARCSCGNKFSESADKDKKLSKKFKVDGFMLCVECFKQRQKGSFCPVCDVSYADDDYDTRMMECGTCKRWIHGRCESISEEQYQILSHLPDSIEYTCRLCDKSKTPLWLQAVKMDFLNGYESILRIFTKKAVTESRKRRTLSFDNLPIQETIAEESFVQVTETVQEEIAPLEDCPPPSSKRKNNGNKKPKEAVENTNSTSAADVPSTPPKSIPLRDRKSNINNTKTLRNKQFNTTSEVIVGKIEMNISILESTNIQKELLQDSLSLDSIRESKKNNFITTSSKIKSQKSCLTNSPSRKLRPKSSRIGANQKAVPITVLHETSDGSFVDTKCCKIQLTDVLKHPPVEAADFVKKIKTQSEVLSKETNTSTQPEEDIRETIQKAEVDEEVSENSSKIIISEEMKNSQETLKADHLTTLQLTPKKVNNSGVNSTLSPESENSIGTTPRLLCTPSKKITCFTDLVKSHTVINSVLSVLYFRDTALEILDEYYVDVEASRRDKLKQQFCESIKDVFPWFDEELILKSDLKNLQIPRVPVDSIQQQLNLNSIQQLNLSFQNMYWTRRSCKDMRMCAFCGQAGDFPEDGCGRLICAGLTEWMHVNCAIWSSEIWEGDTGALQQVGQALSRSKNFLCSLCNKKGATVTCCQNSCRRTYHFQCAIQAECVMKLNKTVFCKKHADKVKADEIQHEFHVLRKVFVDLEWMRKKEKFVLSSDINVFIGGLKIEFFGGIVPLSVVSLQTPGEFKNEGITSVNNDSSTLDQSILVPDGYTCQRFFWSTVNPWERISYKFSSSVKRDWFRKYVKSNNSDVNIVIDHSKPPKTVKKKLNELKAFHHWIDSTPIFLDEYNVEWIPPCPLSFSSVDKDGIDLKSESKTNYNATSLDNPTQSNLLFNSSDMWKKDTEINIMSRQGHDDEQLFSPSPVDSELLGSDYDSDLDDGDISTEVSSVMSDIETDEPCSVMDVVNNVVLVDDVEMDQQVNDLVKSEQVDGLDKPEHVDDFDNFQNVNGLNNTLRVNGWDKCEQVNGLGSCDSIDEFIKQKLVSEANMTVTTRRRSCRIVNNNNNEKTRNYQKFAMLDGACDESSSEASFSSESSTSSTSGSPSPENTTEGEEEEEEEETIRPEVKSQNVGVGRRLRSRNKQDKKEEKKDEIKCPKCNKAFQSAASVNRHSRWCKSPAKAPAGVKRTSSSSSTVGSNSSEPTTSSSSIITTTKRGRGRPAKRPKLDADFELEQEEKLSSSTSESMAASTRRKSQRKLRVIESEDSSDASRGQIEQPGTSKSTEKLTIATSKSQIKEEQPQTSNPQEFQQDDGQPKTCEKCKNTYRTLASFMKHLPNCLSYTSSSEDDAKCDEQYSQDISEYHTQSQGPSSLSVNRLQGSNEREGSQHQQPTLSVEEDSTSSGEQLRELGSALWNYTQLQKTFQKTETRDKVESTHSVIGDVNNDSVSEENQDNNDTRMDLKPVLREEEVLAPEDDSIPNSVQSPPQIQTMELPPGLSMTKVESPTVPLDNSTYFSSPVELPNIQGVVNQSTEEAPRNAYFIYTQSSEDHNNSLGNEIIYDQRQIVGNSQSQESSMIIPENQSYSYCPATNPSVTHLIQSAPSSMDSSIPLQYYSPQSLNSSLPSVSNFDIQQQQQPLQSSLRSFPSTPIMMNSQNQSSPLMDNNSVGIGLSNTRFEQDTNSFMVAGDPSLISQSNNNTQQQQRVDAFLAQGNVMEQSATYAPIQMDQNFAVGLINGQNKMVEPDGIQMSNASNNSVRFHIAQSINNLQVSEQPSLQVQSFGVPDESNENIFAHPMQMVNCNSIPLQEQNYNSPCLLQEETLMSSSQQQQQSQCGLTDQQLKQLKEQIFMHQQLQLRSQLQQTSPVQPSQNQFSPQVLNIGSLPFSDDNANGMQIQVNNLNQFQNVNSNPQIQNSGDGVTYIVVQQGNTISTIPITQQMLNNMSLPSSMSSSQISNFPQQQPQIPQQQQLNIPNDLVQQILAASQGQLNNSSPVIANSQSFDGHTISFISGDGAQRLVQSQNYLPCTGESPNGLQQSTDTMLLNTKFVVGKKCLKQTDSPMWNGACQTKRVPKILPAISPVKSLAVGPTQVSNLIPTTTTTVDTSPVSMSRKVPISSPNIAVVRPLEHPLQKMSHQIAQIGVNSSTLSNCHNLEHRSVDNITLTEDTAMMTTNNTLCDGGISSNIIDGGVTLPTPFLAGGQVEDSEKPVLDSSSLPTEDVIVENLKEITSEPENDQHENDMTSQKPDRVIEKAEENKPVVQTGKSIRVTLKRKEGGDSYSINYESVNDIKESGLQTAGNMRSLKIRAKITSGEQAGTSTDVVVAPVVQTIPIISESSDGKVSSKEQKFTLAENYEDNIIVTADSAVKKPLRLTHKAIIVYEVKCQDVVLFRSSDVCAVWENIFETVQGTRLEHNLPPLSYPPTNISLINNQRDMTSFNKLGLTHRAVQFLIEQLPGTNSVAEKHKFRFHQPPNEAQLPVNESGCARTEGFKTRKPFDMFGWLASRQRTVSTIIDNSNERGKQDLPIAMLYRNLREKASNSLRVCYSAIHGRGLFPRREYVEGELIIEYAGEMIRTVLSDRREKYYESKGIGCYFFTIDDKVVVDATVKGNSARFINHSCDPNCRSKIVEILGRKHILIFAIRKINAGEELTYDYKFAAEPLEKKISCTCGTKKCRKYLN